MSKRWGSLLSGAVAGLESRLDSILAEEGTAAEKNAEFERRRAEAQAARKAAAAASADAKRAATENDDSSLLDKSSTGTEVASSHAQATQTPADKAATKHDAPTDTSAADDLTDFAADVEAARDVEIQEADAVTRASLDNLEPMPNIPTITAEADAESPSEAANELRSRLSDLEKTREEKDAAHQEEVQGYLERIDALQEKLKYLADEAAKASRLAAQEASQQGPESLKKELALKDEKIAALMQEGQKLSKAEVTSSTALRKMRQKAIDDQNAQAEARRVLAKAERASTGLSERVSKLEVDKREAVAKLARLPRLEREIADLKRERNNKDVIIEDLKRQLQESKKAANAESKLVAEKALEQEQRTAQSLRDDLASAKVEQEIRDGRAQTQIKDLQEQLAKEKQRHSAAEAALRNEMSVLESRLEVLRGRSEEVSSGSTTDSQAKLLRQVETLQSQYSVASENWQILESSLQGRLTALEKERDEIAKSEADARKKARDNGSTVRRLQDQLDDLNQNIQLLEHKVSEHKLDSQRQSHKVLQLEKELSDERQNLEKERLSWETGLKNRLEEERSKWESQSPKIQQSENGFHNLGSIAPSNYRRTSGADLPGLSVRRSRGSDLNLPAIDRPATSRRASSRFGAEGLSISGFTSPLHVPLETPSIHGGDADDQTEHASSPHRTINDMLSVQTTSAGPSVQLVERMSAAVRRLETEKAGTKEEMSRLLAQRDEARKEVVNLMREVDQKRAVETRLSKVEAQFADVNARYSTTLEMLGEKSERVEELEADVADLKKIYRDLVDRSMKS